MDDKAHIRLVDAHAKGNGGSNDLHLVGGPVLLHPLPLIWRQPSMVVPVRTESSGLPCLISLAWYSLLLQGTRWRHRACSWTLVVAHADLCVQACSSQLAQVL